MEATRPSRMPMSARTRGKFRPSTTIPPLMTLSNAAIARPPSCLTIL
jgi:hypothetical protein